MARFYGTINSDKGNRMVTRTGARWIRATAQSWSGSVSIHMVASDNGDHIVEISVEGCSVSNPAFTIFSGRLSDLLGLPVNAKLVPVRIGNNESNG